MGVTNGPLLASCAVPLGSYGRRFHYNSMDVMTNAELLNPYHISLPTFVSSVGFDDNLFANQCTFAGATPVPRNPDEAGNTSNSSGFVRPRSDPSSQTNPADAFNPVGVTYTYNELDQLVLVKRDDLVTIANVYGPNGLRIR